MSGAAGSAITLRALQGEPLADEAIASMVRAAASAIAERQGIAVHDIRTTPAAITVTLGCDRIAALGFAAELRRITTNWYRGRYGAATLWGESGDASDSADAWKRA